MVDISTSAGTFHIADCLDRAIVRHAERQADLTAFVLRATGLFESLSDAQLPEAFLLELAAVIELQVWEQQGLRGHLDSSLPTPQEAAFQLSRRAMKGAAEFAGPDAAPLSRDLLRDWIDHFAWDGREQFNADLLGQGRHK